MCVTAISNSLALNRVKFGLIQPHRGLREIHFALMSSFSMLKAFQPCFEGLRFGGLLLVECLVCLNFLIIVDIWVFYPWLGRIRNKFLHT